MTAAEALQLMNRQLAAVGQPALVMDEEQTHKAFASLCAYADAHRRPLDVAIADLIRYRMYEQVLSEPIKDVGADKMKLILRGRINA